MGEVRCCVCGKLIRVEPALKAGEVSHGYCPDCFKREMKKVDEVIKKGNPNESNNQMSRPRRRGRQF